MGVEEHELSNPQEDEPLPEHSAQGGKLPDVRDHSAQAPQVQSVHGVEDQGRDHHLVEQDLLHHAPEFGPIHRFIGPRLDFIFPLEKKIKISIILYVFRRWGSSVFEGNE